MARLKANRLSHLAHGEEFPTNAQRKAREHLERDAVPVKVIFRKFPNRAGVPSEAIALFPEIPGTSDPATCQSYMHNGQHGPACARITRHTQPATVGEFADLYKELRGLGYSLRIVKRMTRKDYETRKAEINRMGGQS